jgi:hypothetical protein
VPSDRQIRRLLLSGLVADIHAPKRKELTVISESVVDSEIRRLDEELGAGVLEAAGE